MLKSFKMVATLEGISLLLLLFFAMPMKYMAGMPEFVQVIGLVHGLLFIIYIILAFMLKDEQNWPAKQFAMICLLSVVPFGTFYMERRYLKNA